VALVDATRAIIRTRARARAASETQLHVAFTVAKAERRRCRGSRLAGGTEGARGSGCLAGVANNPRISSEFRRLEPTSGTPRSSLGRGGGRGEGDERAICKSPRRRAEYPDPRLAIAITAAAICHERLRDVENAESAMSLRLREHGCTRGTGSRRPGITRSRYLNAARNCPLAVIAMPAKVRANAKAITRLTRRCPPRVADARTHARTHLRR